MKKLGLVLQSMDKERLWSNFDGYGALPAPHRYALCHPNNPRIKGPRRAVALGTFPWNSTVQTPWEVPVSS
jgi:hypothetical protein